MNGHGRSIGNLTKRSLWLLHKNYGPSSKLFLNSFGNNRDQAFTHPKNNRSYSFHLCQKFSGLSVFYEFLQLKKSNMCFFLRDMNPNLGVQILHFGTACCYIQYP